MSSRRSRRAHAQPRYNADEYEPESLDPQDQQADTATDDNTTTSYRNTNNISNSSIQASPIVEQDSIEEVTRCICGSEDLKIPKNSHSEFSEIDTGFFIQCEICSVWQHGYCVGIFDEDNSPEKYWCEQCKPENHTLFIDKYGIRRSKYYPTIKIEKKSGKRKHKTINESNSNKTSNVDNDIIHTSSNSNSHGETETNADGEIESDGDDEDANKRRRKRVTLNSRDYQYELMLKKALEESAKESGVQPEDVNVSSPGEIPVARETRSRKTRYGNNDSDQFELKQESANDDADDDNDDDDEEINNDDDKISNNLELTGKKINNDNTDADTNNNDNITKRDNNNKSNYRHNNTDFNGNTEESEFEKEKLSNNSDTSQSKHKNKKESSRNNKTKKSKGIGNVNNENEGFDSGNMSESQSQSQAHSRSRSQIQPQSSTSAMKTNTRKTKVLKREKKENRDSKITDDKPFRANIPSARISLNEMRRRIFSIMEFVSNIQIELSNEEEFKNSLLRLDTNSFSEDIKDCQHQLVSCYNDSVIKLDSLTKKLNAWENQYH